MMCSVTVVTLSTGSAFLIINGHTFRREDCGNGATSRWCCNEPVQAKCDVYAHVNDKYELVLIVNKHNHEPVLCRMLQDEFEYYEVLEDDATEDVAMFIESKKGKIILLYKGYRYRKAYRTKNGIRWTCSSKKDCSAFVYLNDEDEILMTSKKHDHPPPGTSEKTMKTEPIPVDTAVIITSRKGKEMLLIRSFTYRKQYETANKARWVCSTKKNCHAVVFTDVHNLITSALEDHNHDPPKYYLDPKHILGAIREPLFCFESE